MTVVIKPGGAIPGVDGDINEYEAEEVRDKSFFDRGRRVIFVNGMLNSAQDHKDSAEALSLTLCCPVIGVYNASRGFVRDLGQCIYDKANLFGDRRTLQQLVDQLHTTAAGQQAGLTKADWMAGMLDVNPAVRAMFDLLRSPEIFRFRYPVYAHSQGNLIASNALAGMYYSLGASAIAGWKVASFGSPSLTWPSGLDRVDFSFTLDPVGWLNFMPRWSNVKVGWVVSHAFLSYLEYDAEFTTNKHRVKFGPTLNFDEDGLARELVSWGVNPLRLWAVFRYLQEHARFDSDDVACSYVKQLVAGGQEQTLFLLSQEQPDVLGLLIDILNSGWTSSEEKKMVSVLARYHKMRPADPAVAQ